MSSIIMHMCIGYGRTSFKEQVIGVPLMERAMEPTAKYGAENF